MRRAHEGLDAGRKLVAITPKRTNRWEVPSTPADGTLTRDQMYRFRRAYSDLPDAGCCRRLDLGDRLGLLSLGPGDLLPPELGETPPELTGATARSSARERSARPTGSKVPMFGIVDPSLEVLL